MFSALIEKMREAFGIASQQANARGPVGEKPNEEKITDSLQFAEDDETPTVDEYGDFYTVYTPFSWRNENGKQQFGYLIKGANNGKIYGLETDNGLSMPPSAVKDMLYRLAYRGGKNASFSKPQYYGFRIYQPEIKQRYRIMPSRNGKDIYED